MTKWLESCEPEWAGVPAWLAAGQTGLHFMSKFEAAGFTEQEAGSLALYMCTLDTEQRLQFSDDLKTLLELEREELDNMSSSSV